MKRHIDCRLYPKSVRGCDIHAHGQKENNKFDPKKANKYHQCACRSTKVDRKCMFDGKCKTGAIVYNIQSTPTGHTYIGKSQGNIAHKIHRGHINGLVSFWNLRDKYDKYIAKEGETIAKTPKGKTRRYSTVVTPECSQELT